MDKLLDIALPQDLDYVKLFPCGDIHAGSILHNEGLFDKFVRCIMSDDRHYIIVNGDALNNNIPGAVGSPYDDNMSPKEQKRYIREKLMPISDRILAIVGGNHERRTKKITDENPLEEVAFNMGLEDRYFEDDCFIKLSLGKGDNGKRIAYSLYCTHGAGGGKRPGSSLNNLELLSLSAFAEIYIIGHHHKKTAHKAGIRVPDLYNNRIRTIEQLYVISSSWQDFGGYAAQKMMRPSALGSVPIYLSGKEKYYEARI